MRDDAQIPDARVVGEDDLDEGRGGVGSPALIEDVGDSLGRCGAARERLADRAVDRVGVVPIEEAEEPTRRAAEVSAAQGDLLKERARARARAREAIAPAKLGGAQLVSGELLEMRSVLDLAPAVVASHVSGDFDRAVEDAQVGLGRDEGEGFAHERRRDRVVVEVEADVRRLAARNRLHEIAGEGMLWERQEELLFLLEGVADRPAIRILWARACRSDALGPVDDLLVEVGDTREGTGGEEGVAKVLDRALDLALLVAAIGSAWLGREVIVPGELEDPRIESDVLADALEDDALEVVVEERPRHAAEGLKGEDVAPGEALGRLVEDKAGEDRAREAEHHHEAGETSHGAADLDLPEAGPVHLSLLARHRFEFEKGLARERADLADVPPDHDLAPVVSALADHAEEARSAQTRVSREGLAEKRLVRIKDRGDDAWLGLSDDTVADERALDGVVMDAELARDRADLPVLHEEEAPDPRDLLRIDHRPHHSRLSRRVPPKIWRSYRAPPTSVNHPG